MHKEIVLGKGLRVITKRIDGVKSVALGIWIGVGGRFENRTNSGISHFLEHMVFKGSQKRTAEDIKKAIEGLGGTLNGFTGEECTCYWVKIMGEHQKIALDVLSDMIINPKLKEGDIGKERIVILEEIKMYKDLPNYYVQELLDEILWPGNQLSLPLAGSIESVSSIRRNDLFEYKKRCYSPHNIAVVAVGNVNEDEILQDSEKIFSPLKRSKSVTFKKVDLTKTSPRVKFHSKETEQTHLAIGIHALSKFDPDRYALDMLNIILGANMSSRLFNEVREKRGLAYEIVSHVKDYQDTGVFSISAGVDNKKVKQATEVIIKEVAKLKKAYVKKDELARAKEFFRGQFSMMLEETLHHMLWLGERAISKEELVEPGDILDKVERVTLDDIRKVAGRLFKVKDTKIALIGPHKGTIEKDMGGAINLL